MALGHEIRQFDGLPVEPAPRHVRNPSLMGAHQQCFRSGTIPPLVLPLCLQHCGLVLAPSQETVHLCGPGRRGLCGHSIVAAARTCGHTGLLSPARRHNVRHGPS